MKIQSPKPVDKGKWPEKQGKKKKEAKLTLIFFDIWPFAIHSGEERFCYIVSCGRNFILINLFDIPNFTQFFALDVEKWNFFYRM